MEGIDTKNTTHYKNNKNERKLSYYVHKHRYLRTNFNGEATSLDWHLEFFQTLIKGCNIVDTDEFFVYGRKLNEI